MAKALSTKEVPTYLKEKYGVSYSVAYLQKLRVVGGGAVFRRFGQPGKRGKVVYELTELDKWMESRAKDCANTGQ